MIELIRIGSREAEIYGTAMGLSDDEIQACVHAAAESDPALVVIANHIPVAMCGFVPTAILSGTVYAWMQDCPAMYRYRYSIAKTWREIFQAVRLVYPRIVGHCSAGGRARNWLIRLGARFDVDADGRPTYMIGSY